MAVMNPRRSSDLKSAPFRYTVTEQGRDSLLSGINKFLGKDFTFSGSSNHADPWQSFLSIINGQNGAPQSTKRILTYYERQQLAYILRELMDKRVSEFSFLQMIWNIIGASQGDVYVIANYDFLENKDSRHIGNQKPLYYEISNSQGSEAVILIFDSLANPSEVATKVSELLQKGKKVVLTSQSGNKNSLAEIAGRVCANQMINPSSLQHLHIPQLAPKNSAEKAQEYSYLQNDYQAILKKPLPEEGIDIAVLLQKLIMNINQEFGFESVLGNMLNGGARAATAQSPSFNRAQFFNNVEVAYTRCGFSPFGQNNFHYEQQYSFFYNQSFVQEQQRQQITPFRMSP